MLEAVAHLSVRLTAPLSGCVGRCRQPTTLVLGLTSALFLAAVLQPAVASAQFSDSQSSLSGQVPKVESLDQYAYQLRHQSAANALMLVRDLLSERGRVELQGDNNTLVVVDTQDRVSEIGHLLQEFDHQRRELSFEIQILYASQRSGGPSSPFSTQADADVVAKLSRLLPYNDYRVVAKTELDTLEGRNLSYELGSGYSVQFGVGTVVEGRRLKLHNFQVLRKTKGESKPLYNSHVNLWMGRPLALGFARNEKSESSLVVAVTCREAKSTNQGPAIRRPGSNRPSIRRPGGPSGAGTTTPKTGESGDASRMQSSRVPRPSGERPEGQR